MMKPSFILDIDECANEYENDCDANALCTNIDGSYICRCIRGYEGDGRVCTGKEMLLSFFLCANGLGVSRDSNLILSLFLLCLHSLQMLMNVLVRRLTTVIRTPCALTQRVLMSAAV